MEINEGTLKKAFCKVLSSLAIGSAETNCDNTLPQKVFKVIPGAQITTFPERIMEASRNIVCNNPFGWSFNQDEPLIDEDTTFSDLFNEWFTVNVFEE